MLLSMVPMVLLADVKQFDPFPLVPDAPFAYPGTRHCLHAVHTHAQSESRMLGQIVVCVCVNVCGLPTCFARILVVRAQLFSAKASHLSFPQLDADALHGHYPARVIRSAGSWHNVAA